MPGNLCSEKNTKWRFTKSFDLSCRYIDDVLSLNNPSFVDLIYRIYPKALDIKDTTDTVLSISDILKSASYPDLHLDIDSKGKLSTNVWLFIQICQLSFHLLQHPFSKCVWSFHITTLTLYKSLLAVSKQTFCIEIYFKNN